MKKMSVLLTLFCLVFSLVACTTQKDESFNYETGKLLVNEIRLEDGQKINEAEIKIAEQIYQLSEKISLSSGQHNLAIKANIKDKYYYAQKDILIKTGETNLIRDQFKFSLISNDSAQNSDIDLTIDLPKEIIAGQKINFSGTADDKVDKVIISVDGWPLTDEEDNPDLEINDGSYSLNYRFSDTQTDRRLVVNAFDQAGNSLKQIEKRINVLTDEQLTVQYPSQIKQDETITISGQALAPIDKVIVSVDGYPLTNSSNSQDIKIEDGRYKLDYEFSSPGANRRLVVNGFDKNGNSIKQLENKITVQGDKVIDNVPYYYQYHNSINPSGSCQNTSLAMVLNYYGWSGRPDDISNQWGTSHGQTPEGLAEIFNYYAQNAGLAVRVRAYRHASTNRLNQLLANGRPTIVHGHFTSYGHVITLTGFDGNYYYANDPAGRWNQRYKGNYAKTPTSGQHVKYQRNNLLSAIVENGGIWLHEIYYLN